MNKIIAICVLSFITTLFILGCVANSPEPQKTKQASRFIYLGVANFPSGSPLEKIQYHVFQDKKTGVEYMYFHTKKAGGSEYYGGPVFCPLFNTIP